MGTITTSDGTKSCTRTGAQGSRVVVRHGRPLNADASDDQARGTSRKRR